MIWNYRAVHQDDGTVTVHEVSYNTAGKPCCMTMHPAKAYGATKVDVIRDLEMILRDLRRLPIFVPPKKWAKV